MLRTRPALVLAALVSAALLSPHAGAATKPLLTDPKGDAVPIGDGFDILSANLVTSGATKKVGKKSVYTPKYFTASATFSGKPSTVPGSTYTFYADTSACDNGYFEWRYHPGNKILGDGSLLVVGCGEPIAGSVQENASVETVVAGNTITWKLRLSDMGKDLPVGSQFRNMYVLADVNDPVTNIFGTTQLTPAGDIDYASTKSVYTLR